MFTFSKILYLSSSISLYSKVSVFTVSINQKEILNSGPKLPVVIAKVTATFNKCVLGTMDLIVREYRGGGRGE